MTPKQDKPSKPKAASRRRRSSEDDFQWHAPSPAAVALLVLGCIIGVGMWRDWVWILDTFSLALHEAGHPIVGLFSATLMVYGGTLFQLLFPWLTKRHFQKKENPAGVVFSQYWMAASIHNVAIYMADARAKVLPLVGGLDPDDAHDWAEILWRWGLLRYDTAMGKLLMLGAWALLLWAMWRCYRDIRGRALSTQFGALPVPQSALDTISKEDALVEQFKHLRKPSEPNKTRVEKPELLAARSTSPPRPTREEQD